MTTVASLISVSTAAQLLARGFAIASGLGLSVSSWRAGDPTLATIRFLSEVLVTWESRASQFIRAGFLSTAEGDWLTLLASELYNVTRTPATYATSTVSFLNSGGAHYDEAPGDVTISSSTSGQTYRNTEQLTLLGAGTTASISFTADTEGSDGSAGLDEIDTLVTNLLEVTITGSSIAVGVDEQDDIPLREQCAASTGQLSPDGPPDAYEYVARNSTLTGTTLVTRASTEADSSTGVVTLYVAGAAGAVASGVVASVQAAIDVWATPLTITATVVSASDVSIDVTATVSGTGIPVTIEADVETAIAAAWAAITSTGGLVSRSSIIALIHGLLVTAGVEDPTVTLTAPASDTSLTLAQVPTVGTVTVTEV